MAERYTVVDTPVGSAARTTSGQSTGVDVSNASQLMVLLNCTAASGTTPTLDVKIQVSGDNVTWHDEGTTFTQIVAASTPAAKKLVDFGRFIRFVWTIAGTTPSFTFSIQTVSKH